MSLAVFLSLISKVLRHPVEGKAILDHLPNHLRDEVLEGIRKMIAQEDVRLETAFHKLKVPGNDTTPMDMELWLNDHFDE